MKKRILVNKDFEGVRLDNFVVSALPLFSRSRVKKLIDSGSILVDGKKRKVSFRLKENNSVMVSFVEDTHILRPYPFKVDIIYEDEDIIVVNKPGNLTVHPPSRNRQNTLVNALLYMGKELSGAGPLRRGIVHRLDKETSGAMVVAKNDFAHSSLVRQFKERRIKKEYRAIVWGIIKKDSVAVNLPLKRDQRNRLKMKVSMFKSKEAFTNIEVIERFKDSTYIRVMLLTGRMHQVRVHMSFLGHPILGDNKYGKKDSAGHLFLHSFKLGLYHPRTDKYMEFKAPLPEWFTAWNNPELRFGKINKSIGDKDA